MLASDTKDSNEQIRRLQGSFNDLISLQALPAIWNGRESGHIVATLLDVLVSVLRLNFAYARLSNSINGSPAEFVRLTQRRAPPLQPQEIGRALDPWLANPSASAPLTIPNPTDDGDVRIVPFRLGLMDEIGVLVVGSERVDFPTATETLLLRVAANQALAALQEARLLHEQKRAAEELERHVADRTAQLTAANKALRESEKRYRTLFDSIDEGFCTIEVLFDGHDNPIDYRFLEVNPSFEKQTGIQNARGRRMREISGQHEEHWFEMYGRIALTGEPVRFENQAAQLHRWYDTYAFRVGEPADRKVAILFNDITERKQAEAKLRRSEEFLLEAQKLSHTGSWRHVIASGEVTVSPEIYRIHDIKTDDDPSNTEFFFRSFHPEDRKRVVDLFRKAEIEKTEFEVDYRVVLPDGTIKHLHTIGRPVLNESGGLVEFVGTAIDVTAAKRSEEALRRSESNLAEAQRLTHTGSWVWRVAGGEAVHLSEEWYRIYGFDPEKGMPSWEQRLQRVHPEDRAAWQRTIRRAIHERSDYQLEFRILLPGGAVKYIHTVGHPVLSASGDLVEFVGSATDITGRKRAEMLLGGEKRLLEMIARGQSRAHTFDALCRLVEELSSGSLSSILLLDPKANCLRHGAAPSLPKKYTDAIDGAVIGPCVGSCGTAAYRAEPVIVSDIASDPLWANFRELALGHGLRACWSTPILSSAGKVLGTFAIYYREPRSPTPQEHELIEQITHLASIAVEREQAQEAQLRLGAIVASSDDAIISKTLGGVITSWNAGAERIFGYTAEEAVGRPINILIPPDRGDEESRIIDQLKRGESVEHFETVRTRKDARQIHVSLAISPIRNPAGQIIGASKIARDITARKRAEEALRRQANLLDQTHDAIIVWEFPRTIVFWNRGAEQLYGFSREEAIGHSSHELLHTEHPLPIAVFEAALERQGEWAGELRHRARNGRNILVESRQVLVGEADGRRLVLETNRDITERKRAEEALRQAHADLAHVSRVTTMGELTASIAHEVNQPLTAVLNNANACLDLLAKTTPNVEEVREALAEIVDDTDRASKVIARVRQLAKKAPFERTFLNLRDVITEVCALARYESASRRVSIRTELLQELPPVLGDRVQLQQVLLNLVVNGMDAMSAVEESQRLLIIRGRREIHEGIPEAWLSVQDSGAGFKPDAIDRLFEAFYTTKQHGMGMGLAISRSIIEAHGGRLWAEANHGPGATFFFTLPVTSEHPGEVGPAVGSKS